MKSRLLLRHVAVPQDHGSWVFILSPLLIGLFAGGRFNYASFNLIVAAMAAFMLRQPATMLIKIVARRRTSDELPAARFWFGTYLFICLLAVLALVLEGFGYVTYLAVPGMAIFGWHLWLVSRRDERKQSGVEIVATGALSLAAPAAYWVGIGDYNPWGWWLWILVWMQTAASIVYAYLRLDQREWKSIPTRWSRFRLGWRAYLYTSFNLLSAIILGTGAGVFPKLLFLPYLIQWAETIWGIDHPAIGWKPTRIGVRQLIVSTVWTVVFILIWR
jgi:hypothetical protein